MGSEIVEAVRDLHARYSDAVWRHDYASFGECFAADGEWRIGGLELRGRARIVEAITAILGNNMRRVLITWQAPIVHVDGGGRVTARTMMQEQVARLDGTGYLAIGRYYEEFAHDDGRWRFAWRLFERHYSGPADLSGEFFEWPDYGPPPAMPPRDAASGDYAMARWGVGG
ncbi:MAG: nuclear transport factor 2 family protein [Sphingomonadales bacterium]|nr:nuclear transport factor 2 family protein [Sphingomonadales bacterium]